MNSIQSQEISTSLDLRLSRVGVVTVSYNSDDQIDGLLESINISSTSKLDIVIVVNSSSIPKSRDLPCRLIHSAANVGFGRACNAGTAYPDREYVLFVNPDVRLTVNTIDRLVDIMDQDQTIGILAPISGGISPIVEEFQSCFPAGNRNIGSCFLMRRSKFLELGGFDEAFFLWWEDTELRDRVVDAGLKACLVHGLVVAHEGAHSTSNNDTASSAYLTKVWISSHFYYRLKRNGIHSALPWCVGMSAKNAFQLTFRRSHNRTYFSSQTALLFGIRIILNFWRCRSFVRFDGEKYPWS